MDKKIVERLLASYGQTSSQILGSEKGYRNQTFPVELTSGEMVNLILYKREPDILQKIRNANYVSNFVAGKGLPARETVDDRILILRGQQTTRYTALYNYLPGTTIPWEAYTMRHIKQLGAALSNLHAALKDLRRGNLPLVVDECRVLLKHMEYYFCRSGVQNALARKLSLQSPGLSQFPSIFASSLELPTQALHMDFVRGNILFEGEGDALYVSGILDFEKTAWGPVVFDIARTLAFLLVDCKYKTEEKVRKYFLQSGYNKRGQNTYAPSIFLEDLVDFFLIHDFYKFLRHNPYEFLEQNKHFARTKSLLIKRKIIESINLEVRPLG